MNNKFLVVFIIMLLISVVLPVTGHEKEIFNSKRNDFSTDFEEEFEPLSNGVKWMRTYGITGYDHGYSVLQTDDGGYIVAGRSYSDGDITDWIIKTDDNGNIIWNETYRERGFARSIKQTNDGGYIILGQVFSRIDGSTKPSLIKIDSNGNMMWNKTFNKKILEHGWEVTQTDDDGYILTGTISWQKMGLIKTDSSGNEIWNKTHDGNGMSVKQTDDGGYIITGIKNKDLLLLKTDSNGEALWTSTFFGGRDMDWGYSVEITNDGGYIVAGFKDGTSNYIGDHAWVIKTDSNGDHQWNKTYGRIFGDIAYSIQQTSDGGFIIAGNSYKFPSLDGMLIKINSNGDEEWARYIGGHFRDEFNCVQQTSDGGYIIIGCTGRGLLGFIDLDVWLVKTDSDGIVVKSKAVNTQNLNWKQCHSNMFFLLQRLLHRLGFK